MRRLPLRSPPRMRGKGIADDEACVAVGSPPRMQIVNCPVFLRCPWDHPRVCGEKMVSMIPHRRSQGSPPRVRGKVSSVARKIHSAGGITPAYAGKRRTESCNERVAAGDHPRVCGEKHLTVRRMYFQQIRDHPRVCGEKGCCKFSESRKPVRDHPRVCGEKTCILFGQAAASGCRGPSRMRGEV